MAGKDCVVKLGVSDACSFDHRSLCAEMHQVHRPVWVVRSCTVNNACGPPSQRHRVELIVLRADVLTGYRSLEIIVNESLLTPFQPSTPRVPRPPSPPSGDEVESNSSLADSDTDASAQHSDANTDSSSQLSDSDFGPQLSGLTLQRNADEPDHPNNGEFAMPDVVECDGTLCAVARGKSDANMGLEYVCNRPSDRCRAAMLPPVTSLGVWDVFVDRFNEEDKPEQYPDDGSVAD